VFEVKATQHVLVVNELEKTESYFLDKRLTQRAYTPSTKPWLNV
jgi:hypothetical protein|tara:strand:- start:328 stop:459 length:132 start_codon:yes stop_codon:yes gene_type:complete